MRLGFVVPRYGRDIVGGAERLVRDFAEHTAARGDEVRVLTTCARDHFSWRNQLPAGTTVDRGVTVHRFPVTASNRLLADRVQLAIDAGFDLPPRVSEAWLANAGWSDPMLEAIPGHAEQVDALIFSPYLFATSVFGARLAPDRSLLLPCLHDESYARFPAVAAMMTGIRGILFNTEAERRLARRLYGELPASRVVGTGFDTTDHPPAAVIDTELVAFAGRREAGKGVPELAAWVAGYNQGLRREQGPPVRLAMMGTGDCPLPAWAASSVDDLGLVSEQTKRTTLARALCAATLSRNESFSHLLMESWLESRPVIVHAECAVTREHCEAGGGGLWVDSPEAFAVALDRLRGDPELSRRLGSAGRRYVEANYSWAAVLARFDSAVGELMA